MSVLTSLAYQAGAYAPAKEIVAYVTDGSDLIDATGDLQSIKITAQSSLFRTVMRQAEITYLNSATHNYLGSLVEIFAGFVNPNDQTPHYINYGEFKVVSIEDNNANGTGKARAFDRMYEALQPYDLEPIYDIVFPCTVRELVDAICTRFGWDLNIDSFTQEFPNKDLIIEEDRFTGQNMSFRDVLDQVAEATASTIYFDYYEVGDVEILNQNRLTFRQLTTEAVDWALSANSIISLKVDEFYGPVNSLVLSRMPQEDNIVDLDQASIDANGLTEIKIVNNILMDHDRPTYITEIFDQLSGQEYFPFKAQTTGLGIFQIGDRIMLFGANGETYECVVWDMSLEIGPGYSEIIQGKKPDLTTTPYDYAGVIGQAIRDTEIQVNKQDGVITLLNSLTTELQTEVTELTQTVDGLSLDINTIGGSNLLKNSVGLKGSFVEWQQFDENGDLIDVRNNAVIDQSINTQENTESGSAFLLVNQFITQTIPTIIGETYTFYCRFKKNTGTLEATISGVPGTIPITEEGFSIDEWYVFRYEFVAASSSTTIRIENTEVGAYSYVGDIVVKLGEVAGWTQAPNEIYGQNYKFDKDGFQITSPTDDFMSLLDNTKLAVYDVGNGNKILMLVSKDAGKITKLVAQETFTVQRYENSASSMRLIPTATGAMLVIND